MPGVKPLAATVNVPTLAVPAATAVTPEPPSTGVAFTAAMLNTTPRAVTVAPPSLSTVPPSVAALVVTPVLDGLDTVGAPGARVTVTVYVRVVTPSCAVTSASMVLLPAFRDSAPLAAPLVTAL